VTDLVGTLFGPVNRCSVSEAPLETKVLVLSKKSWFWSCEEVLRI